MAAHNSTKNPPSAGDGSQGTPPARAGARERITDPALIGFLQDLEIQKRSRYTIKHYGLVVQNFHEWLTRQLGRRVSLLETTAADLKQYQIHLTTQRNYAKNSLYHVVKALHAFYRFNGSRSAEELKAPRRAQALPKYLTETEAKRLRESARSVQERALASLLLYSGLRVGEACRLTIDTVDFREQVVRVQSGKGDKDRLVVVAQACLEDLRAHLSHRNAPSEWLFPRKKGPGRIPERTVQRMISRLGRRAGIGRAVTPHMLRHTLATTLLRRGGDIRFIQKMLGHASIATTQVYTHLDDAELRRMYTRAQPEF